MTTPSRGLVLGYVLRPPLTGSGLWTPPLKGAQQLAFSLTGDQAFIPLFAGGQVTGLPLTGIGLWTPPLKGDIAVGFLPNGRPDLYPPGFRGIYPRITPTGFCLGLTPLKRGQVLRLPLLRGTCLQTSPNGLCSKATFRGDLAPTQWGMHFLCVSGLYASRGYISRHFIPLCSGGYAFGPPNGRDMSQGTSF